MSKHSLNITMDQKETDFIRNTMNRKVTSSDETYDWKFIFDDNTIAHIVIAGPRVDKLPDFPLVYSRIYNENWTADEGDPVGVFFGRYFFRHGSDDYELNILPCDNKKWTVHKPGTGKPYQ